MGVTEEVSERGEQEMRRVKIGTDKFGTKTYSLLGRSLHHHPASKGISQRRAKVAKTNLPCNLTPRTHTLAPPSLLATFLSGPGNCG